MTTVLIDLAHLTGTATNGASTGMVEVRYSKRIEPADPASQIVVVRSFAVKLDATGKASVVVPPSEVDGFYTWAERVEGGTTRYTSVPDVPTVNYRTLVDVDPATFDPTVDATAAWYLALAALELGDLADVDTTDLADGFTLVWEAASSTWKVGAGGAGASALADLTDVDLTDLADGDALVWDATAGTWVRVPLSSTYAALGSKGRTLDIESYLSSSDDITDALLAAIADLGGSGTIILPPGLQGTISAPINLAGVSLFGFDPNTTILHANPATTDAEWVVGPRVNDTAMLWAPNASDWSIQNIGLDLHGSYCAAVSAYGGDRIQYINVRAVNGKKAQLQFSGNYTSAFQPVRNSWIRGCYVEKTLWGYVFDGKVLNSGMIGNIAKDSVLAGISVDPGEAELIPDQYASLLIQGNIIDTQIARPAEWTADPSDGQPTTGGIRVTQGEDLTTGFHQVTVHGNTIRDWAGPMSMLIAGAYALVSDNMIHNETAFGAAPIGIEVRQPKDGTTVTNNTIINSTTGINEVYFNRGTVALNRFQTVTTKIASAYEGPGVIHFLNQKNGDPGITVEADNFFNSTEPNVQAGTAYTLALADQGKTIEMTNAAANTVTIPTAATVAIPIGAVINVFQAGTGQTTIAAASGVTLRAPNGDKIVVQYGTARLRKRAYNEWVLDGDTAV